MQREIILPENDEQWHWLRAQDLTSTQTAALFNLSPYLTKFELWHLKKDAQQNHIEMNERMLWGTRLESSIAFGIAQDNGWVLTPLKEYIRLPELRLGSSFDFKATIAGDDALLEIKNVGIDTFHRNWLVNEDGSIEAPPHIEMQLQHQLFVSGLGVGYIGALVGGNSLKLIRRTANKNVHASIMRASAEFWHSINEHNPPVPDFVRDAQFIASLYDRVNSGTEMHADETITNCAEEYKRCSDQIAVLENKKAAVKAEMLTLMAEHEKVRGEKFTISAGLVPEATVPSYTRKGYRTFKINWRKQ